MLQFFKKNWMLIILSVVGLIIYLIYFPTIYSINSINAKLSRSEIIEKAENYLIAKNFHLKGFNKNLVFKQNSAVIHYLHKIHGLTEYNKIIQQKLVHTNYWRIYYYLNLPRNIQQESFQISVSMSGAIIHFSHNISDTLEGANMSSDKAQQLCEEFLLKEINLDLTKYSLEKSSAKKLKNRTDHYFTWVENNSQFKDAKFTIQVNVKGDEVSGYNHFLEIPTVDSKKFQETETAISSISIISLLFSYIILILIAVIFLKKYHQGEIGVKHGLIFFLIVLVLGIIHTVNSVGIWSQNTSIGSMPYSQVNMFMMLILIVFVDLFVALTVFTGWSVGESYAREGWSGKLTAIDTFLNGRIFTLNSAYSIVRGYLSAFILLGFFMVFSIFGIKWLNGWTSVASSLESLDKPVIFLFPLLGGLIAGITDEIVFRLFFITYLKRITRTVVFALIFTAIIFMVKAPYVSLYPMSLNIFYQFCFGLILGYLFIKYDILTTIIAT